MSPSATSSSSGRRRPGRLLLAALLLAVLPPGAARAVAPSPAAAAAAPGVHLTIEEALELAFGEREVRKGTLFLSKEALARAEKLSGERIDSALLHPYVALEADGSVHATAYIDAHRVRTMREALFIVVDPGQRVRRIELLSFAEPPEYAPRAEWYAQILGRKLDDELRLKRGVRGISGATMSARATVGAVRRVLALHRVTTETAD